MAAVLRERKLGARGRPLHRARRIFGSGIEMLWQKMVNFAPVTLRCLPGARLADVPT